MKERNKVANVFTDIAPEWNNKGNLIASCIGHKNPFKTEYKNWIRNGMRILDVGCGAGKNLLKIDSEYMYYIIWKNHNLLLKKHTVYSRIMDLLC